MNSPETSMHLIHSNEYEVLPSFTITNETINLRMPQTN